MKARKGNKEYTINEIEKDNWRQKGYDIYNDKGKLEEFAIDKKVSYEQYEKLQKENEELKKKIKD